MSTLVAVILVNLTLKSTAFKTGTMAKPRHVKNEALTEVVYLIPTVAKIYIKVIQKDKRKDHFKSSLLKFLNRLMQNNDKTAEATINLIGSM